MQVSSESELREALSLLDNVDNKPADTIIDQLRGLLSSDVDTVALIVRSFNLLVLHS